MGADFVDYVDLNLNDEAVQPWDGTQNPAFEPPDPGDYTLGVIDANVTQSKKGNPTLLINFRVVSEGPMKDKECRQWYSLNQTAGSRGRLKQLILAAGVIIDERGGFSAQALVGAQIQATIAHEDYNVVTKDGAQVTRTGARVIKEREVPKDPPPATTGRGRRAAANNGPPVATRR